MGGGIFSEVKGPDQLEFWDGNLLKPNTQIKVTENEKFMSFCHNLGIPGKIDYYSSVSVP